jgi:hypothetical protein
MRSLVLLFFLHNIPTLHACDIGTVARPQAASMLHSLHAILKGALSEAVEIEADATAAESAPQLQVRSSAHVQTHTHTHIA